MSDVALGNEKAGCSLGAQGNTILLEGWGFWDKDTALELRDFVLGFCRDHAACALLKIDFNRLNPLRDEGQAAFQALLAQLPGTSIRRVQIEVASHMTKLQLIRIVAQSGQKQLVEFLPTAVQ